MSSGKSGPKTPSGLANRCSADCEDGPATPKTPKTPNKHKKKSKNWDHNTDHNQQQQQQPRALSKEFSEEDPAPPAPVPVTNTITGTTIIASRYKTKMCRTVLDHQEQQRREGGADPSPPRCPYEHRCMFAHSKAELRTTQQNMDDGLTTEEAIKQHKDKEFRKLYPHGFRNTSSHHHNNRSSSNSYPINHHPNHDQKRISAPTLSGVPLLVGRKRANSSVGDVPLVPLGVRGGATAILTPIKVAGPGRGSPPNPPIQNMCEVLSVNSTPISHPLRKQMSDPRLGDSQIDTMGGSTNLGSFRDSPTFPNHPSSDLDSPAGASITSTSSFQPTLRTLHERQTPPPVVNLPMSHKRRLTNKEKELGYYTNLPYATWDCNDDCACLDCQAARRFSTIN